MTLKDKSVIYAGNIRSVQKTTTKPSSVVLILALFQAFKYFYKGEIDPQLEDVIYNIITGLGGIGIFDEIWQSRKKINEWIKKLFTKKG